jgi:cation diffusion facilitator family transporter
MKLTKIMQKSFIVNIILVFIKIISGLIFNSVALVADGIHSISDLLSDVFVLLGIGHSLKPADEDHPFGHGKFEYILSLFLGLSIILIAFNLGKGVIENFEVITQVPSYIVLVVVLFVVIIKFILARYLITEGEKLNSEIIKASGKESLSDVISSIVVFIGVISVLLGDRLNVSWLLYGDKISSILIAAFIIRIGIIIVLDAVKYLQGKTANKDICNEYSKIISKVQGVEQLDKLDMISYGPYYQAIVEISVKADITVKEGHDIADDVQKTLLESEQICHVSIHVNPEEQI